MARLRYGGTPADFVIAQGADADIVDENGDPTEDQGAAVLLPLEPAEFTVYLDAELVTSTTDLLDADDQAIETVSQSTDYDTRGTIPVFQGPDGHEGPVWLSADGVNGYRMEPDSAELYQRVGALESGQSSLSTSDLSDWTDTPPSGDDVWPRFNLSSGQYELGPAPEVGSASWDDITDKPATFPATWSGVSGKPSTFPPASHDHDDRYYTKSEVDGLFSGGQELIEAIPSLHRWEDPQNPGVYDDPRGTARTDLVITWHGTLPPTWANSESQTDWLNDDGVALAGVDMWFRVDE